MDAGEFYISCKKDGRVGHVHGFRAHDCVLEVVQERDDALAAFGMMRDDRGELMVERDRLRGGIEEALRYWDENDLPPIIASVLLAALDVSEPTKEADE